MAASDDDVIAVDHGCRATIAVVPAAAAAKTADKT